MFNEVEVIFFEKFFGDRFLNFRKFAARFFQALSEKFVFNFIG